MEVLEFWVGYVVVVVVDFVLEIDEGVYFVYFGYEVDVCVYEE